VTPGRKHAADPKSTGLLVHAVRFPSARDSVMLNGWWFEGPAKSSVVVLCPRGQGTMADLLPAVTEFARRGFTVMTYDLRDFGPAGPGDVDSLRDVIFASRWVDDTEGAFRYARAHADSQAVFAWGQDLGGPLAVAATARNRHPVDALVVEGLFRTAQEQILWNGTSQAPGVAYRHRQLVDVLDDPLSAVANLRVPLMVILAMKDTVTPAEVTDGVTGRSLSRIDRWRLPTAGHDDAMRVPGYFDKLAGWYKLLAFNRRHPLGY
jgi:pimeloyl-ACP methyl ester carboxylesterase